LSGNIESEVILEGLGVSPGVAIGPAHIIETGTLHIPDYQISADNIDEEVARFSAAREKAERQLRKLKNKSADLHGAAAEELNFLLDAHLQMLSSSRVRQSIENRIRTHRQNAEAAVQAAISQAVQEFAALDDPYIAARAKDVREVGSRLLRNLTKTPYQAFKHLPPGSILIAEDLTPADTALLDPKLIPGFITALGGAESHTAIMARALALPAVLGVNGLLTEIRSGNTVIIDGDQGRIILRPTPGRLEDYRRRQIEIYRVRRQLDRLRHLPALTTDGKVISLMANLELPREAEMAINHGAEGIGLLRTEFLFMNCDSLPDEEKQYALLSDIIKMMDGKPVTIRTLDIGGDKVAAPLGANIGTSANPALGLRAIRLSLKNRELLDTQLAAILRASIHGPVRILLPMISSVGEVKQVRDALAQIARRLKQQGIKTPGSLPPIGVMVEVPGAALIADALAQVVDFFAIGTNDLTMYTLAVDRGEEQVAHLYNPLHSAVLRLIHMTVVAATRADIPVSLCGEMAGDPRFTPLLLGLGIENFSMAPINLPRVKNRIRNIDLTAASRCAHAIMEQSDSSRIAMLLDDFNNWAR